MTSTTSDKDVQVAKLFAKKMIARPELKAIQNSQGEYRPLRGKPFTMPDMLSHIAGTNTYGHYLINTDDQVKMFCFDVDLRKTSRLPISRNGSGQYLYFKDGNPREHWGSRKPGASRDFIKFMLKTAANQLMRSIYRELGLQTAAAYSGSKGVHVYGFMGGKVSSELARQGAQVALNCLEDGPIGHWELERGTNIFGYKPHESPNDPDTNFEQINLEIYPKQDSLEDKDLGNLLRLPLGVNHHSPKLDKAFFLDMRTAVSDFLPRDPVEAMTTTNPWE